MNYEKMYFLLFNTLSDAIESIERFDYGRARELLITAQQQAEEEYIEQGEDE